MPNLMHLRLAIPLLALLIPTAYANPNSAPLKEISDQYVEWQRPGNSSSQARDLSADGYTGRIAEKKRMLDALLAVGGEGLSAEEDIDRRLLIGILRAEVNTGETLRRWENDPSLYLPGPGLDRTVSREPGETGSGDPPPPPEVLAGIRSLVKNLASLQEIYYAGHYTYTQDTKALFADPRARIPDELEVDILFAGNQGWAGMVTLPARGGRCLLA